MQVINKVAALKKKTVRAIVRKVVKKRAKKARKRVLTEAERHRRGVLGAVQKAKHDIADEAGERMRRHYRVKGNRKSIMPPAAERDMAAMTSPSRERARAAGSKLRGELQSLRKEKTPSGRLRGGPKFSGIDIRPGKKAKLSNIAPADPINVLGRISKRSVSSAKRHGVKKKKYGAL